ncbi:hypothetical protein [Rouxiella sp. WC2420]|uniref:Uncharacterized protein n=1 Tax=Rouxiella sp. WC2420 TaxID=3234145 RepID=A0AB39VMV5_9GAMM
MDKFDRTIQNRILQCLYEAHPEAPESSDFKKFEELLGGFEILVSNMLYLSGHGLISTEVNSYLGGKKALNLQKTIISSKGIDFLRNDGGLGAILNVINVRLHSDTINKLESIIGASNVPEEEKASMISTLRKLPEDAIKHLNLKLLDLGLSRLPDAVHVIQTALHNLF